MAFNRRQYSGNAPDTTLSGAISAGAATLTVVAPTGYPSGVGSFVIVVDPGTSLEEKILCASLSGSTVTVASSGRGYDGTTATSHSSGAVVRHVISAVDMDEANQAAVATLGAVTATGDMLVGTGPNALGRLPIGLSANILTSNGTTAAWAPPAVPPNPGVIASQVLPAPGSGLSGIMALSTSITPISFTNGIGAVTVTFTFPASGRVMIDYSCEVYYGGATAGGQITLGLQESGSTIDAQHGPIFPANGQLGFHVRFSAGGTAGSSHTYTVAIQCSSVASPQPQLQVAATPLSYGPSLLVVHAL